MKKLLFYELLNHIRHKPNFKKKLKLFAAVGVVGIVVVSTLVIWAGVSAVRFAGNQIQGANIQGHVESLANQLEFLPTITTTSCWDKAQSLLALESWTTRPLSDNFKNLKSACIKAKESEKAI